MGELVLANGDRVDVQTSTRIGTEGNESTFVSIDTGHFRIRIVQRISANDLMPEDAKIAFSNTSETDNLFAIESLSLSLTEAVRIAERLNKEAVTKRGVNVNSEFTG